MTQLTPILLSDIGLLNQIASDIEVLIMMFKKLKTPPLDEMMTEIDEFKTRVSSFRLVELDYKTLFLLIDDITTEYEQQGDHIDLNLVIKKLEYLYKYFSKTVEGYVSSYLTEHKINMLSYVNQFKHRE